MLSSVQSLSRVRLFAAPWTAAHQASLSMSNSHSPPKSMSIESVMPSNHLILCRPLLLLPSIFPSIRVFSNESAFAWGGQSIGVSASTSVLPMNTQDWSPLGLVHNFFCFTIILVFFLFKIYHRDFPGGPVVKTFLSTAGSVCSIPDGGARFLSQKNQNIKQPKQFCNNLNKDFKIGPPKKTNKQTKKQQQHSFYGRRSKPS